MGMPPPVPKDLLRMLRGYPGSGDYPGVCSRRGGVCVASGISIIKKNYLKGLPKGRGLFGDGEVQGLSGS